jgi:hypothetical protein
MTDEPLNPDLAEHYLHKAEQRFAQQEVRDL